MRFMRRCINMQGCAHPGMERGRSSDAAMNVRQLRVDLDCPRAALQCSISTRVLHKGRPLSYVHVGQHKSWITYHFMT